MNNQEKTNCCEKCKDTSNGSLCWQCPCHSPTVECDFCKGYPDGDFGRCGKCSRKIDDKLSDPTVATSEKGCKCELDGFQGAITSQNCRLHSPIVATSEKECPNCSAKENNWAKHCNECNFIGCYQCIDEHSHTPNESSEKEHNKYECEECIENMREVTPNESEDWEEALWVEVMEDYVITAELGYLAKDQKKHKEEMRLHRERLEDFIKRIESKAYQRGREEGLFSSSIGATINQANNDILDFAVQEIEKEKKCIFESDGEFHICYSCKTGMVQNCKKCNKDLCDNKKCIKGFESNNKVFNEGLDKAKSILLGLKNQS